MIDFPSGCSEGVGDRTRNGQGTQYNACFWWRQTGTGYDGSRKGLLLFWNKLNVNGNWNKEGSFAVDLRNKCKLEFSMISFMLHSIPVYLDV